MYLQVPKYMLIEFEKLACKKCHITLPENSKFCMACGTDEICQQRKWLKCLSEKSNVENNDTTLHWKDGVLNHSIKMDNDFVYFLLPLKKMKFQNVLSEIEMFKSKIFLYNVWKDGQRMQLWNDDRLYYDSIETKH